MTADPSFRIVGTVLAGFVLFVSGCGANTQTGPRVSESESSAPASEPQPEHPSAAPVHEPDRTPSSKRLPATTADVEGDVAVVMTDIPMVFGFQVTPRDFYVATRENRLLRVRRSSGERTMSLDNVSASRLVADDKALYYSNRDGLFRIEHDSATSTPIVKVEDIEGLDGVVEFALDDAFLYFTPFQEPGIFCVPKRGGAPEKLSSQKRAGSIALSETHVYFASFFRNRIGRLPKAGGPIEPLIPRAKGPVALAVDEPIVVALMETSGDIVTMDATTRKRRRLADAGRNPLQLLFSDGDIYWSTGKFSPSDRATIRRVAATGGPTETLVSDEESLSLLHIEAGKLYFSPEREASILTLDVSRNPDASRPDK